MTIECSRCGDKGEHEGGGDEVKKINGCIKCQSVPDEKLHQPQRKRLASEIVVTRLRATHELAAR